MPVHGVKGKSIARNNQSSSIDCIIEMNFEYF